MTDFALYIPTHNDSLAAIQSVQSATDWQVFVVDNGSAHEHREAIASLASPRITVIMHDRNIGRVQNWKLCVEHFQASGSIWFKMLTAGDRLKPGALDRFRYLIGTASGMSLFVPGVEHVGSEDESGLWYWSDKPAVYEPADTLKYAATRGNLWHSLSACFIHRRALERAGGFSFGEGALTFCADMLFMAWLAKYSPTHFMKEPLVERHLAHRNTYGAELESPNAILEESLVRLRCAQFAHEIDPNTNLDDLIERVRRWALSQLHGAGNDRVESEIR